MASLEADFRAFARNPGSVLDGALLVSRVVHPATDAQWCRGQLASLAARVPEPASAEGLLISLREAGFKGATSYYEPANSALALLLSGQPGIPISLAALIISVADLLGLAAEGLNFPGHFLLQLDGLTVDPFTLQALTEDELAERLASTGVAPEVALKPASASDMVLRMLNNLRGLAVAGGDHQQALTICDYQLCLANDAFPVLLARAESWFALGSEQQAARELERALPLAPGPEVAAQLTQQLRELSAKRRTLH